MFTTSNITALIEQQIPDQPTSPFDSKYDFRFRSGFRNVNQQRKSFSICPRLKDEISVIWKLYSLEDYYHCLKKRPKKNLKFV